MDFFIQSITNPSKKPNSQQSSYQPRPPPSYAQRQPPPQSNQPHFGGGYNPNFRPTQPQRPQPPPMMTPPQHQNNSRFPNQNYGRQRDGDYQQSQQRNNSPNQGFQSRGRPHMPRQFRDPSPSNHQHQDYDGNRGRNEQYRQYNEKPEGQQHMNRNRRPQQNFNNRNNQYNAPQYNNNRNFQPRQRQDFQRNKRSYDNRNQNRQQDLQPQQNRYEQRPPPPPAPKPYQDFRNRNKEEGGERQYNSNRQEGRGRQYNPQGRGRYRGRPRGRGRQFGGQSEQKPVQKKVQVQSDNSMDMQENEPEKQSESKSVSKSESKSESKSKSYSQSESQHEQSVEQSGENQESSERGSEQISEEEGNMPSMSQSGSMDLQRIDGMVSKEEFEQRIETFRMNNRGGGLRLDTGRSFAIFELNKKTNQPDIALTLKRFRRSTNRGEGQNQKDETIDCPRSIRGLSATIKHINKYIIDADEMRAKDLLFPMPPGEQKIEFLHIYDFLWNRMREMIKDVSRLQLKDRGTQEIIIMCQQMLRFFIIAIREGRLPHKCKLQFDSKMNLESITKILTQLLEIYQMTHQKLQGQSKSTVFISPNQPEIIGYAIILSNDLQRTLNEKLRVRLNGDGLDHPLLSAPEVENALKVKKALKNRDYETFYSILQRKNTDYVQACLLIHNLPTIRKEVLRVFQKSSTQDKYNSQKKNIPVSALKRGLGFSNNLNAEFYHLLENIGIEINRESGQQTASFVGAINQNLQDFQDSFSFDFGYNKKDKVNYPYCDNKAAMLDSKIVSREELIKRSWHKSNYLQQCAQYYQQQFVPQKTEKEEIVRPINIPVIQTQLPKQQSLFQKSEDKNEKTQMNLNYLLKKKEQLNRSRFLKSLQTLIQNLIRRSDVHSQHQRKRGIAMIIEFMEVLKAATLYKTFHRLYEYSQYHKIAYQTLNNLNQFAENKKKFLNSFNKQTYEFQEFHKGTTYRLLSEAVQPKPKQIQQVMNQLIKIAESNPGTKKARTLIIFASSSQLSLTSLHIQFLKNICKYLVQDSNSQGSRLQAQIQNLCNLRSPKPYLQFNKWSKFNQGQLNFKVRFYHYRVQQQEQPMLSGYDSIIFLDLHASNRIFAKLVKQMTENRKKIMIEMLGSCPKLSTQINTLLVSSIDKFKQKIAEGTLKQEWNSKWHFLQNQAIKLSLPLRHHLLQTLAAHLADPPKKQIQIQAVTVTSIINQIDQNMQFAEGVHSSNSSLEFFQKYLTANIKYLKSVLCKIVEQYESYDWNSILLQAAYLQKPNQNSSLTKPGENEVVYPEEKINLNTLLYKKLQFSQQITRLIGNINIFDRYNKLRKERPYLSNSLILAGAVEQYLQLFEKQQRSDTLEMICELVINNNCSLTFKNNAIQGDARALTSYIMVQLKKQLKFLTILLPKGFRFKLLKRQFEQNEKKQISKMKSRPPTLEDHIDKTTQRSKLKYVRQDILQNLQSELRESEGEKFKNLRSEPMKAIKI